MFDHSLKIESNLDDYFNIKIKKVMFLLNKKKKIFWSNLVFSNVFITFYML